MHLRPFTLPCLLPCLLLLAGCASTPPVGLELQARQLMQRERVHGLAMAIIDHGRITSVHAWGQRDVARGLPLQTDTIMYGASLTKTAFAYMVLQLVDEGLLDLDASIATLLPKPLPAYRAKDHDYTDLAGDERWRAITPRMLLNHASGFANFRFLEPDGRLRLHFAPGTRYAYSGEGIQLLQVVLEQGLGLDVGKEMQRRVFDRFGMRRTSMTWRPDFAANLAHGYTVDGKLEEHDKRSRVRAAGSMDTTIADQARLWAGMVRGDGLSARARAELVRAQLPITSARQFPTLAPGAGIYHRTVGLAAGLGVVVYRDAQGSAWFKGGHNDSTGNLAICQEWRRRCLVMLANDVRAERIYPELARLVLGDTRQPWAWEYGPATLARTP
ncbi:beta-lactamase family protein [Massilia sp. PAMC28688]|uniref:serine hydrolase domain-containing protein n=1 Tax=Massilia sp. PAMC28688 TaxID=2861283 RepID=UPI001C62F823|nr:serine hydrolase domain-containing protein [Massilia sp. PAMC28688]QYF93397.1 beta-lactamase family protein [Massilia sp. PAMC28688]